jgi:hypothetical protein
LLFSAGQRAQVLREEEARGLEGAQDHRVAVRGHQVGREEDEAGDAHYFVCLFVCFKIQYKMS